MQTLHSVIAQTVAQFCRPTFGRDKPICRVTRRGGPFFADGTGALDVENCAKLLGRGLLRCSKGSPPGTELRQNAPCAPNIRCQPIGLYRCVAEEKFGGSIPQRLDIIRVFRRGCWQTHREAEVADLDQNFGVELL